MSGYTLESPVSPQITPRPSSTASSLSLLFSDVWLHLGVARLSPDHSPTIIHSLLTIFTIFRCLVTPWSLPSLPRSLPDHHPQPPHYLYYFQMSGYTVESPVSPQITPRPSSTASSLSLLFLDVWLHRGVSRLSPDHSPTIIHSLLTIFTIFRCLVTPWSRPSLPRSLPDHHPQPPHYLYYFQMSGYTVESPVSPQITPRPSSTASSLSLLFSDVWLHRGVARLSPDHSRPSSTASSLSLLFSDVWLHKGVSRLSPDHSPTIIHSLLTIFTIFRCLVTPWSRPSLPRSLPDHHPQPPHYLYYFQMSGYTLESPVSPQITPRPSSTASSLSLLFSDVWLHRGVARLSPDHSPTIIHSLLTIFTIFRCLVTPWSRPSLPRSLPDHHPQPPHYLYYFQMSGYTVESPVSPQITPRPSSTAYSLSLLFSDVWLHRGVARLSPDHSPTIIHSLLTIFTIFRCLVTPWSRPSLPRSLPDHHSQPPHYLYYFQMSGYTLESPVSPQITPRPSSTASSLSLLFSDVWLHRGVARLSPDHSPTIIHSLLTIFTIFRCLVTPWSRPSLPRSLPDHHPQPPHYLYYFQMSGYTVESPVSPQITPRPSSTVSSLSLLFSDVWLHLGVARLSPDHSPTIIHSLVTCFLPIT